jgi:hypothetical protein
LGIKGRLSSTFKVLQITRQHKKSQNAQTFEHQSFSRDAQFVLGSNESFQPLKILSGSLNFRTARNVFEHLGKTFS